MLPSAHVQGSCPAEPQIIDILVGASSLRELLEHRDDTHSAKPRHFDRPGGKETFRIHDL